MKKSFQYIISAGGLDTEKSYPFSAKVATIIIYRIAYTHYSYFKLIACMQQATCRYKKKESGTAMSGMVSLPSGDEKELLAAVATVGPVSIVIDGGTNAFRVSI